MPARSVITIGNFDGVHIGHRAILSRARALADAANARVLAITFDPHPAAILRPGGHWPRLMTLEQRVASLREAGADEVVVMPATRELLSLSPWAFLEQSVMPHGPLAMVEGPDFHFGKDRAGDMHLLERIGQEKGFAVSAVEPVVGALHDQIMNRVSSSQIRWLIANGRVADASLLLAQDYALIAPVVAGEKRGRTIGVPTANLAAEALEGLILPADGVYAGTATLPGGLSCPAAISVGIKPTFEQKQRVIEAHLIDYDSGVRGEFYGQPITLRFSRWLRDQQRFPSVDALRRQLGHDIGQCRTWARLGLLGDQAPRRRIPVLPLGG